MGFEPTVRFPVHTLSRRAPSTARTPIHVWRSGRDLYAEGVGDIFTDKAIDEIYRYSAGSARSINKLCTHALMFAAQRAKRLVDDHMIRTVIAGELP